MSPHNITDRDGVFTVRTPAWHGIGPVLLDYPTREEAQAIAHPWNPVTEPVYRFHTEPATPGRIGPPNSHFDPVPGWQLVVRDDTRVPIGVVTDTYQPVTNDEMWDIAQAIEGEQPDDVLFETAGSLKGGAKVWILLRLRKPLRVDGDPNGATIPYYALQNGNDGGAAFRGQATMTRIVCDNTAQIADLDAKARGTEFMFRHTKNIKSRVEEAKKALDGWRNGLERWRLQNELLLDLPIKEAQREWFLEEFVPMPPARLVTDRVVGNVEQARALIRSALASQTCEGIDATAYGLVQASVEYCNHLRRAKSEESRFRRSYLDRNTIVGDAVRLAQRASSVTV